MVGPKSASQPNVGHWTFKVGRIGYWAEVPFGRKGCDRGTEQHETARRSGQILELMSLIFGIRVDSSPRSH